MDIEKLKYFLAVAYEESFSEAAEYQHTTQSVVSKQVIALEKELNTKLFDRSKRRIVLTPEGRAILQYAQRVVDEYNALIGVLEGLEKSGAGTLTIASIPMMVQYGITDLIAEFAKREPGVNVQIGEREASYIPVRLENGEYELAFLRKELHEMSLYDYKELFHDKMVAVLPKSHALANHERISLTQLQNDSFLLLNQETRMYNHCIGICENLGFIPRVSYSGKRVENIIGLVGSDMGVSMLMEKAANYFKNDRVVVVPLEEDIQSCIVLTRVKNRRLSRAAQGFWDFVT